MIARTTLLAPVQSLCTAFQTTSPLPTLLSHFTKNPLPLVHEHGLPHIAPFLGRSFTGLDGVGRYFELIADILSFENMTFEPDDQWIVDEHSMAVCLRGSARFIWKATGQSWDETFVYRVSVAEDLEEGVDRQLKVVEYRVWADTGAAYLASQGSLKQEDGKETRAERDRKRSGCGDVVGGGMSVYGGCR